MKIINPYDNIGQLHNQGLDFIINSIQGLKAPLNLEAIAKLSCKFVTQFYCYQGLEQALLEGQIKTALNYLQIGKFPSGYNEEQISFINNANPY